VSGIEKERGNVENIFFSVMTKCVFILTPCNINAISDLIVMNNIRNKLIMIAAHYGDQIIEN